MYIANGGQWFFKAFLDIVGGSTIYDMNIVCLFLIYIWILIVKFDCIYDNCLFTIQKNEISEIHTKELFETPFKHPSKRFGIETKCETYFRTSLTDVCLLCDEAQWNVTDKQKFCANVEAKVIIYVYCLVSMLYKNR